MREQGESTSSWIVELLYWRRNCVRGTRYLLSTHKKRQLVFLTTSVTMAKCVVCSKNHVRRRNSVNTVPPCLKWFYTHRSSLHPKRRQIDSSTPSPSAVSESDSSASLPGTCKQKPHRQRVPLLPRTATLWAARRSSMATGCSAEEIADAGNEKRVIRNGKARPAEGTAVPAAQSLVCTVLRGNPGIL